MRARGEIAASKALQAPSADLAAALHAELEPGEEVHWIASPDPALFAAPTKYLFLFGVVWCSFLLVWTAGGLSSGAPLLALFSLPFWAIGFYILGAPSRARRKARRTVYALTNRRALILTDGPSRLVTSLFIQHLHGVERQERPDGRGNLILRQDKLANDDSYRPIGFFGVANVRETEALLASLRPNSGAPSH